MQDVCIQVQMAKNKRSFTGRMLDVYKYMGDIETACQPFESRSRALSRISLARYDIFINIQ